MKKAWSDSGIWNNKWGIIPGISWKHEQPLEEMLGEDMSDDPVPQANAAEDVNDGTEEAPSRSLFGPGLSAESNLVASLNSSQQEPSPPLTSNPLNGDSHGPARSHPRWNLFAPPLSSEANRSQVSSSLNASLLEPRPATDPAGLLNGDANYSSTVHLSKVSKACAKRAPGRGRQPNASRLLSEAQQSLPGQDFSAPHLEAAAVPVRRSSRLQEAKRKAGADSSGAAPDSHDSGSQSRPRRISAGAPKSASSAKPRGASKRRQKAR